MALSILKRTRALSTDAWSAWASTTDAPPYVDTTLVEYKALDTDVIDIKELTDGSIATDAEGKSYWTGTGYFDIIMVAINGNVKAEYESGRIIGVQYAEVYLGALQSALQSAVQLVMGKPTMEKTALEAAEVTINAAKQREVLQAQKELYKRQKAGFDDNKQQKILEAQLNAWGITFQDTDTTFVPTQLAQAGFTESFNAVRADYYDVCDDICGA